MTKNNFENLRIGHGIDYHNLIYKKNNIQPLGGIKFLIDYSIQAHSDGDIIIHSISNAILGALGIGDIGEWFSDREDKNINLNSLEILEFALKKCSNLDYKIINIDLTIITDHIHMQDKKNQIKEFLEKFLNTSVNVKATRFENDNKQIKCCAVCLLVKNN